MTDDKPGNPALSTDAVIERAIAARGDVFPEWRLIAEASPETMATVTNTGGYLHKYEGIGGAAQQLSVQMRELIATPAICGKSDLRHAPNHVRRMYRLGMTNRRRVEIQLERVQESWDNHQAMRPERALQPQTRHLFGRPGRVAFVTHELAEPDRSGGIGTAVATVATILAAAGHDVTIVYVAVPGRPARIQNFAVEYWKGCGVTLVEWAWPSRLPQDFGLVEQRGRDLLSWLDEREFDVIHFNDVAALGRASVTAKRAGLELRRPHLVVITHGSTLWHYLGNGFPLQPSQLTLVHAESETIARADHVISPSGYMLEWMDGQSIKVPRQSHVLPLTVRGDVRHPRRWQRRYPVRELVFFGRLEPRKGLDIFCDAIDELTDNGRADFDVTFLGATGLMPDGGFATDYIEKRASRWGFHWRLIPNLLPVDAQHYLRQDGVLAVVPSHWDNYPNTVLECVGGGIPFVSTLVGGIPEIVHFEDRSRVLVADRADKLAAALRGVLDDGAVSARPAINPEDVELMWLAWHGQLVAELDATEAGLPAAANALEMPTVAVCVPREESSESSATLRSVMAQTGIACAAMTNAASDADRDQSVGAAAGLVRLRVERVPDASWAKLANRLAGPANAELLVFVGRQVSARPTMVRDLVAAMRATEADAVVCSFGLSFTASDQSPSRDRISVVQPTNGPLVAAAMENVFGGPCFIVRRPMFEKLGGFVEGEASLNGYEHWDFLARLLLVGGRIEVVPLRLYDLRRLDRAEDLLGTSAVANACRRRLAERAAPVQRDLVSLAAGLPLPSPGLRTLLEREVERLHWLKYDPVIGGGAGDRAEGGYADLVSEPFQTPFAVAVDRRAAAYERLLPGLWVGFDPACDTKVTVRQAAVSDRSLSPPDHEYGLEVRIEDPGGSPWLTVELPLGHVNVGDQSRVSISLGARANRLSSVRVVLSFPRAEGQDHQVELGDIVVDEEFQTVGVSKVLSVADLAHAGNSTPLLILFLPLEAGTVVRFAYCSVYVLAPPPSEPGGPDESRPASTSPPGPGSERGSLTPWGLPGSGFEKVFSRVLPPERLARTVANEFGETGEAWIRQLPDLIASCAERWALTVGTPFPTLQFNFAAPALRHDGSHSVIKVGFALGRIRREAAALQVFDGAGAVRLLEADLARGVLLLERAIPGHPPAVPWDEETALVIEILRNLWQPSPSPDVLSPDVLKPLADQATYWRREIGNMRARLVAAGLTEKLAIVDRVEGRLADLLSSMQENTILHGDLHPRNILSAARTPWLAVDPIGYAGERAFDAATSLRENRPVLFATQDPLRALARRADELSDELELDPERVRAWAMVQAVTTQHWRLRTGGAETAWNSVIELLAQLDRKAVRIGDARRAEAASDSQPADSASAASGPPIGAERDGAAGGAWMSAPSGPFRTAFAVGRRRQAGPYERLLPNLWIGFDPACDATVMVHQDPVANRPAESVEEKYLLVVDIVEADVLSVPQEGGIVRQVNIGEAKLGESFQRVEARRMIESKNLPNIEAVEPLIILFLPAEDGVSIELSDLSIEVSPPN